MLLNGTIRRKMCVGLVLLLGMLATLSTAALTGLTSYRRLIRELEFSIHECPRRADLAEAVGSLFHPLLKTPPTIPSSDSPIDRQRNEKQQTEFAEQQQREFTDQLATTRRRVVDFHRRLDQLPPQGDLQTYRTSTEPLLRQLQTQLAGLEEPANDIGTPKTRRETVARLLKDVARLETLVQRIPDYQPKLDGSLEEAREVYISRLRLVIWSTVIVVALFGLFAYSVYFGILNPIRLLHQGAARVADGDFQYQLDLPGRGEITELANAFNKMTSRFQETRQDLNQQVGERSRQLIRSERLAGIGFLAAGVAHEINNPLSAISMAAESLAERAAMSPGEQSSADDEVTKTYLAMIRREAERCQQITRKLLDFARGNDGTRDRVDLTQLINEVIDLVRPMGKYSNRHIEFYRTQPCPAEVNGTEIKQVVLNIVSNALEATDDGGTLRIGISEQTDAVQISFDDDGCGMTPDVREHLFDPFFTRRKDGKGTGLGMAISQRIIADHDGTLEADSPGPKMGSTFRIRLPRRATPQQHAA